jgi:hypothetical protein
VLKELQLVADSADSLKRNRGRRGLDILQKIQKMSGVDVIDLGHRLSRRPRSRPEADRAGAHAPGKIVTNDFNLNKVAQLRGVDVLNINELANSLKPVVLPGEFMKVFILKEGKEYNQGVAYLDDGTMVVVDNARKMISKTIDIVVTSVLQTTAGKMIFGPFHRERRAAGRCRRRSPVPAHRPRRHLTRFRAPSSLPPDVLVEELERSLPRELRGRFVVARRRVVVEAVLRALVHEHLVLLVVRLQRRLVRRDAAFDALIVAGVVQHQRRLDLRASSAPGWRP